jgi:hypothetical protein
LNPLVRFDGDGGGAALSLYHNFNPGSTVPLNGIVRASMNCHVFSDASDTANNFKLPGDQPFYTLNTGLRWGGKEPLLTPRLAAETRKIIRAFAKRGVAQMAHRQ